jgi:hypothetical protein
MGAYVVVIGDKEMEESTINVTIGRSPDRISTKKVQMTPEELNARIKEETPANLTGNCRLQNTFPQGQSSSKEFELRFSFLLEDRKFQRAPPL